MRVAAFLPLAAFVVIVGGVGWRMLRLWRETRELPELALGVGLFALGLLATPLSVLGRLPALAETLPGRLSFGLGMACVAFGEGSLFVFTWSVFRRRDARAKAVAAVACAALAAFALPVIHVNLTGGSIEQVVPRSRPWLLCTLGMLALCFTWSCVESLSHHAVLRRRLALGLADPVVVNRFLLWGLASGASVALVSGIVACLLAGMVIMREPLALTLMSVSGGVMSAAWYLTFFAPEGFRRFLRARAAARMSA